MKENLREILNKYGFSFKKAYGQNFLTDEDLLNEIADLSGVNKDKTVLEIGCGAGALTKVLADKAKKVIGYEIDKTLKPILDDRLSENKNVEIIYKDVMKVGVKEVEKDLPDGYIMVANLPYYITTPIITEFIENSDKISALSVMVQEEVAKRFSAKAGTSDYGAITVAINLRGGAKIIKTVGREKFTPVPNVDSAVVLIDIDRGKNKDVNLKEIREAVKCGFLSRRKMLVNNLINYYKMNREQAEEVLKISNIPLTARGETLTEKDFIMLSENVKKVQNGKN